MRNSDFGTTTLTNEVSGGLNLTLTSPRWVSHGGRNALQYNQTSQSVGTGTITASSLLDFSGATAATIIARINFVGNGGNNNGRVIGSPFSDHVLREGTINSTFITATTNIRWSSSYTPTDKTCWVAYSYDSSNNTTRLIVDGVQASSTTGNNAGAFSSGLTGTIKLGADQNVTSLPRGFIYEVAIFKNRALTATECDSFAKARRFKR